MDTDPGLKGKMLPLRSSLALGALVIVALSSGCSKSAQSVAAGNSGLFTSAPLKDEWDTATAAMQTNGFVVAITTLNKMRLENPAPDPNQLAAINDTIKSLNKQMLDLANGGDANARSALQQLGASQSNRR